MKPEELSSNQSGGPLLTRGSINVSPNTSSSQDAAAGIIRSQIDDLYSNDNQPTNTYQREHAEHVDPQAEQWKQYHSAWQNYYQKYYEGYYTHHLNKACQEIAQGQSKPVSKDEELLDLRQKLIGKVKESATKVRKSRHFIPIISGIAVVLIFLFLQYNRILISNVAAYISPGTIDPQNIIINPNAAVVVSSEPRLIIPKINVDVPVIYGVGSDYDSQMTAMAKGVAQFSIPGAESHPGQIGNTVLSGHSSNDLLDSGDYKFIFAQLDKLVVGDTIYINYNSIRYTYTVTGKTIVSPSEVSKLVYATTKPILTLITCTPLGTSKNRLLVAADQVSPDPSLAEAAPGTSTSKNNSSPLPGNSPTLFERIFGSK